MTIFNKIESSELFMGKISNGSDLLEEITDICRKKSIMLGRIEAIGAVQKARLAFYNQQTREYQFITIDQPLEITQLVGNISLKDGEPVVHAHITFADKTGQAYGGHLAPGTVVFACEFIMEVFTGQVFERKPDKLTGLHLWEMRK
ncbi:MAG: DNA-binding protein [Proteobacteria bacterium]|nr:DNA-binding protein [Pseudomonadota bacterium]